VYVAQGQQRLPRLTLDGCVHTKKTVNAWIVSVANCRPSSIATNLKINGKAEGRHDERAG